MDETKLPPTPLRLLSVVIPAQDEEGCIGSTVTHLHVELKLQGVPHEIVVVDDGSTDGTWALKPMQNHPLHGFGRAVTCGLDHITGDAVVLMMADESDDCRDVVRYWELNKGDEERGLPLPKRGLRRVLLGYIAEPSIKRAKGVLKPYFRPMINAASSSSAK